jgi:hypothetical protein
VEHSERGRYVTEQVAVWLENDGEYIAEAREVAEEGTETLGAWVTTVLADSREYSAPWQVAQELAPNDWARIDWAIVAERIKAQS